MRISDWSSDVCSSDLARAAVGDQLGDHRVVIGADPVAFLDARIDADTPAEHKMIEPSGRGQKLLRRILGVKPRLHRPAVDAKLLLPLGQLLGRRDAELRSEEHTSELQSLMRISYAVFGLKKKKT